MLKNKNKKSSTQTICVASWWFDLSWCACWCACYSLGTLYAAGVGSRGAGDESRDWGGQEGGQDGRGEVLGGVQASEKRMYVPSAWWFMADSVKMATLTLQNNWLPTPASTQKTKTKISTIPPAPPPKKESKLNLDFINLFFFRASKAECVYSTCYSLLTLATM